MRYYKFAVGWHHGLGGINKFFGAAESSVRGHGTRERKLDRLIMTNENFSDSRFRDIPKTGELERTASQNELKTISQFWVSQSTPALILMFFFSQNKQETRTEMSLPDSKSSNTLVQQAAVAADRKTKLPVPSTSSLDLAEQLHAFERAIATTATGVRNTIRGADLQRPRANSNESLASDRAVSQTSEARAKKKKYANPWHLHKFGGTSMAKIADVAAVVKRVLAEFVPGVGNLSGIGVFLFAYEFPFCVASRSRRFSDGRSDKCFVQGVGYS